MKYAFLILILLSPLHAGEKPVKFNWQSKSELHRSFTQKFVVAPDFGRTRIRSIDLNSVRILTVDHKKYTVKGVELISVTDRKKPVIWKHGNFINTKSFENKKAEKRELKKSELAAFDKIKKGQEIITSKENGQLFMMGVLKSQKSCIRCHKDYKEGKLMGAFKYTFFEIKDVPAPKERKELKEEESEKETQKKG